MYISQYMIQYFSYFGLSFSSKTVADDANTWKFQKQEQSSNRMKH